jgi:large subunit ribosomal protein L17
MRHQKAGIKLGRTSSHRKAMFRNLVTSLFKHDRIQTTEAKAKELRSWADHVIGLAKRGDLHARRQALAILQESSVVHKLFEEAPKRFAHTSSGYARLVKLGPRRGDAAPMILVELISAEGTDSPKATKKKKTAAGAKKGASRTKKKPAKKQKEEKTAPAKAEEKGETKEPAPEPAAPEEPKTEKE